MTLSGVVEAGTTVDSITISDGVTTITVPSSAISMDSNGNVTVVGQDLSGLADGELTVTMTVTDAAGNTGTVTDTTTLDTAAPSTGDGANSIAFDDGGDEQLSASEATNVTLSGVVEAGATVDSITISDGVTTITVPSSAISMDSNGNVTVVGQDLSGLADGELTVTMTVTDAAGNTGTVTDTTTLDTAAPSTGDGANSIAFDDGGDEQLSASEATNVTLSGVVEAGATVDSITISDGVTTITVPSSAITLDSNGNLTVVGQDLSGLADGELTVTMTVTDTAGNTGTVTDTTTLDTGAPSVTINDNTTNDSTPALTGTIDDPEASIVVTVEGVDYAATNNGDGTWTLVDDTLPALMDGSYQVTVTATDATGNSGTSTGTLVIDTSAPTTGDGANSIAFNDGGDELVSASEATNVTLSGVVEAGATVDSITISDGVTTITVPSSAISTDSNGNVTVVGQDLSGLADGELTVTMTVTDAAGNTGTVTDTTTLDTGAPSTGD